MFKNPKKRLVILVSGGGTNMQEIINQINEGNINAEIVAVISSNECAYALTRAAQHNIETFVCAKADFESLKARDEKILGILKEKKADYIILAGYLGIIPPFIVDEYKNRIINIHPSLLPSYGGQNYYGLKVHSAVLAAKEKFSGATVHFVDSGTDTGLIIAQEKIAVENADTPESLQAKISQNIEYKLLPRVIKDICDDKIKVVDNKVIYNKQ